MFRDLGADRPHEVWAAWRAAAVEAVERRLGHDLWVVVADDPDAPGHLVACGAATVVPRLPNPWHGEAQVGYVQWMATEPAFRRRGHARAVMRGLLDWYAERGVDNIELHASPAGVALYRSEGFWEGSAGLALRRRPWDPPPA